MGNGEEKRGEEKTKMTSFKEPSQDHDRISHSLLFFVLAVRVHHPQQPWSFFVMGCYGLIGNAPAAHRVPVLKDSTLRSTVRRGKPCWRKKLTPERVSCSIPSGCCFLVAVRVAIPFPHVSMPCPPTQSLHREEVSPRAKTKC